jgi:hypothetical protein
MSKQVGPSVIIRIDRDIYEWLKSLAEPFVDTPNSVLRKIKDALDEAEQRKKDQQPAPRGWDKV